MTHQQKQQNEFERWLRSATQGQKLDALLRGQWTMIRGQDYLIELGEITMQEVDDMNAALEENTTVESGLVTLTDKIFLMLQEQLPNSAVNAELKAAIATVTGKLKAQTAETAAALLRNTPAAPDPGASTGGVA